MGERSDQGDPRGQQLVHRAGQQALLTPVSLACESSSGPTYVHWAVGNVSHRLPLVGSISAAPQWRAGSQIPVRFSFWVDARSVRVQLRGVAWVPVHMSRRVVSGVDVCCRSSCVVGLAHPVRFVLQGAMRPHHRLAWMVVDRWAVRDGRLHKLEERKLWRACCVPGELPSLQGRHEKSAANRVAS